MLGSGHPTFSNDFTDQTNGVTNQDLSTRIQVVFDDKNKLIESKNYIEFCRQAASKKRAAAVQAFITAQENFFLPHLEDIEEVKDEKIDKVHQQQLSEESKETDSNN